MFLDVDQVSFLYRLHLVLAMLLLVLWYVVCFADPTMIQRLNPFAEAPALLNYYSWYDLTT